MSNDDYIYRILIVDDDETDRRFYRRLLSRRTPGGFEIEEAPDGAAGLVALRSRTFDCVLLDYTLPDMTGLEFLTGAANDSELPTAFILVTGHGNTALAVEAMKLGVQDYLAKTSLDEGRLWQAIVRAVSQRELRQRLEISLREVNVTNVALELEIGVRKATEVALRRAKDTAEVANAALTREIAVREAAEVELRAAKEVAEEANRAKSRFVAMITHELRTPLHSVLGYAQLLHIEGGLSEQQKARVGAMTRAGRHLQKLIDGVLDFVTIEVGRMELRPALISVHELVEECIDLIEVSAAEQGLGLTATHSHDAPRTIAADPARLRQVLVNLLGNAVKFTTVGSIELRVLAGVTQGALRLEVADTGPGVDDADRERLFRDFERLDAGISMEGAGLGLAISARIVELMGGTIGHKPNGGGGSVFWLELPSHILATSVADAVSAPDLTDAQPSRSARALRVLVVDDVPMNRDLAGAFLRAAGHEVTDAAGGAEAVAAVASMDFDVVLMDVRMPVVDGLEATRRIRALEGVRARVPIVALTAHAFTDQVEECYTAGMDSYLGKPFDPDTLVAATVRAVNTAPERSSGSGLVSMATTSPLASANPAPCPEVRIFDQKTFERTTFFLAPEAVISYLGAIDALGEALLQGLRAPHALTSNGGALAGMAHKLAGSATMFGFERLATLGRSFERSVHSGASDAETLAKGLCAAIDVTHREIQARRFGTSTTDVRGG